MYFSNKNIVPIFILGIVVPCIILGLVAISVVFAVIWKVRHKRRRQGESAVSFVEIAEYHDEERE